MNAYRFYPPGGPEKIRPATEPIPRPEGTQVLIRVHAVSIIGPELTWRVYQTADGSWKPHILGHDFAGVVVELGPDCPADHARNDIQPGSEVVAFTLMKGHEGGLAEYAIADLESLAPKPRDLSFEEAASFPLSALTAWQALHEHAKISPGENVLITGAAGGTGIFLVPMARLAGAGKVIATASSERSFEMLEELGVDQVINYKTDHDLNGSLQDHVDVIIDCVGHSTYAQCVDLLAQQENDTPSAKDPRLISIVEYNAHEIANQKRITSAKFFIVNVNNDHLRKVASLLEKGLLKTIVDRVFDFAEAKKAYEVACEGHAHGKIVVRVP